MAAQQLQPLLEQEVDGLMTAIVFRKADNVGCVLLNDGRNGIASYLTSTATDGSARNRAAAPATGIHLDAFHNDVICVTINDVQLRQRTHVIEAIFFDGTTISIPVQNQEGLIIARRFDPGSAGKKLELVLYDQHQQELYYVRVWT